MSATKILIDAVKTYGTEKIGSVCENAKGVKYRYDYIMTNEKNVPYWMVRKFKDALIELYGTSDASKLIAKGLKYDSIEIENMRICLKFPTYKSDPFGQIVIQSLVIL